LNVDYKTDDGGNCDSYVCVTNIPLVHRHMPQKGIVRVIFYLLASIDYGKGLPDSLLSIWPGADPGVQAVSPQVTISHPPGGRLPLLSARLAVTFPAAEHHHPLAGTKLYCFVNNLPKVVMWLVPRVGFEPTTCCPTLYPLLHCS